MPATRVVIFERKRLLESRLSTLHTKLPIDVKPVRTFDEFRSALQDSFFPIALIEWEGDVGETVSLLEAGIEFSAQSVIFARKPLSEESRLLMRAAGAMLVLEEWPTWSRWSVLITHLVRESQDRLRAGGGN